MGMQEDALLTGVASPGAEEATGRRVPILALRASVALALQVELARRLLILDGRI